MFKVLLVMCFCVVADFTASSRIFRRQNYNNFNFEVVDNPEFGTQKFYSNIIVNRKLEERCNARNFSTALKMNMNFFKCQPREAVVHLYAKEHNVEMTPNKVVVKRCYESGCYGMNSCLPSKTKETKVAVRLNYQVNKQRKCSWVTVVEHTECKCGCKITQSQCEAQNKIFSPLECTCLCMDENARKECQKQENMEWDEETCSCMCQTNFRKCSTGTEWVPSMCKCMRVMSMEEDADSKKYVYNVK